MTRQSKKNQKLKKCDSTDFIDESIDENTTERPCLIQIPGKQTVKDDDIHVSFEAQENYAQNVNTESQLKISQGSKSSSGLKNETFKRLNTSYNSALLKRNERGKSDKNYGFGLDLPDSLRADQSNPNLNVNVKSNANVKIENSESQKIEISKKPANSEVKSNEIVPKKFSLKKNENSPMEISMHSDFFKRVSLGMSALACLTIAMWWGQYKQVNNAEGLMSPQVAMMKSSQRTHYQVVSEKVKQIGEKSVMFIDFELGAAKLNLDQIYAELDRRIVVSDSSYSFRFRFFLPNDRTNPFFDLFAGSNPNSKLVDKFQNREEYRGLSVLWNSNGNVEKLTR